MLNTGGGGRQSQRTSPAVTVADRASQESLRRHNLSVVFTTIMMADPALAPSRADLAERTGLTKATVSALVQQLINLGLVAEGLPKPPQGVGRPAVPLTPAAGTVVGLGLEVNVDYYGIRAVDLSGAVADEIIVRGDLRDSDPVEVLGRLFTDAYNLGESVQGRGMRVVGAGLAVPGLADHPRGPLRLAPNLGWRETDIADIAARSVTTAGDTPGLRSALVDYLTIDNEATLAARTEAMRQALDRRARSFLYISGAIGIGAALVLEGEVFQGLHGWAGEIGHTIVDPQGPVCACGAQGCLEQYAGKQAILRAAGLPLDGGLEELLCHYGGTSDVARRSQAAIATAARALGIALAGAINLVDISETVIGGDLAPLTEVLTPGIQAELNRRVLAGRWIRSELAVRPATVGAYAALTGGAVRALDRVIANPSELA